MHPTKSVLPNGEELLVPWEKLPICSTVLSTSVVAVINEKTCLAIRRWSKCVCGRGRAANVSEAVLEDKCL